ncbi:MAG TPA: hypothetical protein VKU19_00630 [Bryobacteraceae bacterium]|nr:hypothetical protein [Bryobacteraceae bacterium]
MKLLGSVLLFAAVSLAQTCSSLPSRRALQAAASAAAAHIFWSESVGLLESGDTHAAFAAFSVTDPAQLDRQLRGVRVDLAIPHWNGVVYVDESEVEALKKRADWLAKMAKMYPHVTDTFAIGGAADDPVCPFYFSYNRTESYPILHVRGPELPQRLQFTNAAPSELSAIFARAAKALNRH